MFCSHSRIRDPVFPTSTSIKFLIHILPQRKSGRELALDLLSFSGPKHSDRTELLLRRYALSDLMMEGLDAREALEWGLINRVVPDGSIDSEAMKIASELAESPTAALSVAKNLLNQSAGMDRLDVHLDAELTELARIADGPNFAEGLAAFFDKRPADFESE